MLQKFFRYWSIRSVVCKLIFLGFFFFLNDLFSNNIWSFFLTYMNLSFFLQSPLSSSPLSCASFAPWAQRGRVTAALKEIGVAGLVCPCLGLILLQLSFSAWLGFSILSPEVFACSTLHFCQTAQATPPLHNCAWHLILNQRYHSVIVC